MFGVARARLLGNPKPSTRAGRIKAGGSLDDPQARQKERSFPEFYGRRLKQLDATRRSHDTLGVYHLVVVLCSRGGTAHAFNSHRHDGGQNAAWPPVSSGFPEKTPVDGLSRSIIGSLGSVFLAWPPYVPLAGASVCSVSMTRVAPPHVGLSHCFFLVSKRRRTSQSG